MTNREWIQSLSTAVFYRAMSQINNCWCCAYHQGGCIAEAGKTCMEGHVRWLDMERREK